MFKSIYIPFQLNFQSFANLSWNEWLIYNLKQNEQWKMIFTTALWNIWIARNKAVFDGAMMRISHMINRFTVDICFLTNLCRSI